MLRTRSDFPSTSGAGASTPTLNGPGPFLRLVLAALALLLPAAGTPRHATAQTPARDAAQLRREAEGLRRQQRLPEALAAYRAVVEQEPGSFEDRFWVAKLESWTGDLPTADSAFARLLEERPNDYDSRIALADVRLWRGDAAAAGRLLERLQLDHPDDPEVRRRLDALRRRARPARWAADLEYFGERLPGGAVKGAALSLGARHTDRFRWRAATAVQEKFDRTESRAGGEVGVGHAERLELTGSVFLAPGAEVLPRGSFGLGATRRVARRVVLYADYAYLDYRDADVHQAGPAVELYAGRHWLVTGRVRWAATRFDGAARAVHDGGGLLALGYLYGSGSLFRVFAAQGGESFTQPSRELIGRFDARTVGLSWRHYLTPGLGLEALYAHQDRTGGTDGDSWSLRVLRRW